MEVCAKCRTFSTTMFLVSLEVDFLMQNIYRVGLKGLHGFEFLSAAPQLPTDCLTAIFGKNWQKIFQPRKSLLVYPVHVVNQLSEMKLIVQQSTQMLGYCDVLWQLISHHNINQHLWLSSSIMAILRTRFHLSSPNLPGRVEIS